MSADTFLARTLGLVAGVWSVELSASLATLAVSILVELTDRPTLVGNGYI